MKTVYKNLFMHGQITDITAEQNKNSNSDKLKEMTDRLETGIKDVFESEKYKEYLGVKKGVSQKETRQNICNDRIYSK